MSMIFFTYRARTQARQGSDILEHAGVPVRLDRTPSGIAGNGCGYGLRVSVINGKKAAELLRKYGSGYERSYRFDGGKAWEVAL